MELRELATSEASALIERLLSAAEERAQKARTEAEERVSEMRAELDALRAELETEATRAAALEADLDSVIEAHRQVDSDRLAAESARTQETSARAKAEDELRAARELLDRARSEVTRIAESLEDEAAEKALLQDEIEGLRRAIAGLEASHNEAEHNAAALARRVEELGAAESSLRRLLDDASARAAAFETETAAAAQAMRDRYDAELRAARDEARALGEERDAIRGEADTVRGEVQALRGQIDILSAERDVARMEAETLRADAESLRLKTETLRTQADTLRGESEAFHSETEKLRAEVGALRSEAQALRLEAQTGSADKEMIRADADAVRAEAEILRAEIETLKAQCELLRADVTAARASGSGDADELRSLQEMLDASREHHEKQVAAVRQLEARLQEAEALRQAAEAATTGTLSSAVGAIEALGAATSMTELFGTLVRQLATELPRVALFRLKGNHLEGEHGAGMDESVQMKKIVIPMNVDSVITRAASGGSLVRADGDELANSRAPFGGSPVSAIAVPVVFQGESLAVLYADSDAPTTNAHATFALLLVRHATVLLSRLTQELKVLKELREYAVMLLQEAEQMFIADVDSGRPAHESIRRLRDTVDCGRQLFAQRAALEGTEAAGLFDEQVSIVINAQASTFSEALAAATQDHRAAS